MVPVKDIVYLVLLTWNGIEQWGPLVNVVEQNKEVTLRLTGALHQFKLGELDDGICPLITNLQFTILWNGELNYSVGRVWWSLANQVVVKVSLDNSSSPAIAKVKFATFGSLMKLCTYSPHTRIKGVSEPLRSTFVSDTIPGTTTIPWAMADINGPTRDCFASRVFQVVDMIIWKRVQLESIGTYWG